MTNKNLAKNWIQEGKPCKYQHGFSFKGAKPRNITKEKALELLPKYDFGMGFYELEFINNNGEKYLLFNEFSENDLL